MFKDVTKIVFTNHSWCEKLQFRTRNEARAASEQQNSADYTHEEGINNNDDVSYYDQIMSVISDDGKPVSVEDALKDRNRKDSMRDELKSIAENRTWDLD